MGGHLIFDFLAICYSCNINASSFWATSHAQHLVNRESMPYFLVHVADLPKLLWLHSKAKAIAISIVEHKNGGEEEIKLSTWMWEVKPQVM